MNQATDQAIWTIAFGFMFIGLAGVFYSFQFIGFEKDYTGYNFLLFGLAIVFFVVAGGLYFKNRKDKIQKS